MSAQSQAQEIAYPVTKGVTVVFAGFGIATWGDLAALLAAIYSACLIGEWVWKRIGRPFFEKRGWLDHIKKDKSNA